MTLSLESVYALDQATHLRVAFINPEDLDKPAKQQQQDQKQVSLENEGSHEGSVDHAGDSLDDAAAAGELQQPESAQYPAAMLVVCIAQTHVEGFLPSALWLLVSCYSVHVFLAVQHVIVKHCWYSSLRPLARVTLYLPCV